MNRKLNVVELYAGLARTWEAFRSWKCCRLGLLVDINQLAVDNYTDNFPSAPYIRRNLQWMMPGEVESASGGRVDILLGCPPCQGFSDTGKRDPDDPRNEHINVFGRFVRELRPRVIAVENVPLTASSARFTKFTKTLDRLRYRWTAQIVNAAHYGSCQTRQRLLLIAACKELGVQPKISPPTHGGLGRYFSYQRERIILADKYPSEFLGITPATHRLEREMTVEKRINGREAIPTVRQVLAGLPPLGTLEAEILTHTPWPSSSLMKQRMSRVKEGGQWSGGKDHFSHSYGRLHRCGLARTITTYFANPGSGRFWHPTENRTLTVREAARIQGINDDFWFHGPLSGLSKLVGNALDGAIAQVARRSVEACF